MVVFNLSAWKFNILDIHGQILQNEGNNPFGLDYSIWLLRCHVLAILN